MSKKAKKYDQDLDDQVFQDGDKRWRVSRLIKLAENLKPFKIPLKHLNIYNLHPRNIENIKEFVEHVKKINLADLSYPIILDDEGYVMDGRHRVCKALLKGKKSIKAVRFETTPTPCYYREDSK